MREGSATSTGRREERRTRRSMTAPGNGLSGRVTRCDAPCTRPESDESGLGSRCEPIAHSRARGLRYLVASRHSERTRWLAEFENLKGFDEVIRIRNYVRNNTVDE